MNLFLKSFCLLFMLFLVHTTTFGQVGINTTDPDESAILDVQASDKGVLLPRLTTSQRDAILNPAEGLLIFNSESKCHQAYSNGNWKSIDCVERDGVKLNGFPAGPLTSANFSGNGALLFSENELENIENFTPTGDFITDDFKFSGPVGWYRITVKPIYYRVSNPTSGISLLNVNLLKQALHNCFFALINTNGLSSNWIEGSTLNIRWEYGLDQINLISASGQVIYGLSIGGSTIFYNSDSTKTWSLGLQGVESILTGTTIVKGRSLSRSDIFIEYLSSN